MFKTLKGFFGFAHNFTIGILFFINGQWVSTQVYI
jgi:hypothetical protein